MVNYKLPKNQLANQINQTSQSQENNLNDTNDKEQDLAKDESSESSSNANESSSIEHQLNSASNPSAKANKNEDSPKPACDARLKALHVDKRADALANEKRKYESYQPSALFGTSLWDLLMNKERDRYKTAVANIEAAFQKSLDHINCL